jgi:hypothetical protein
MTDHAGFLELAAQQIDFNLTPVEAARLEAHLAACAPCRLKVERLRGDSTALRRFGSWDAPATLEDVVLTAALHGRGRSAPRPWALAFAAALVLAVLAGGALGGGAILDGLLVGSRPTIPASSVPESAEAPSVAPTAVQGGSPTSDFVGDFDVVGAFDPSYGGDPAHVLNGRGHVVARLAEPTDQRLVAGSLDFYGDAGASLREVHAQFAMAEFSTTSDGTTVALGKGVECRYTGPNEATCRQVWVQFLDNPGQQPSQLDFATGTDWPYTGESWIVEGGSFELHVAP